MRERIERSSSRTVMVHRLPLESVLRPRGALGPSRFSAPKLPVLRTGGASMIQRIMYARAIFCEPHARGETLR
jgi:hypothetical protein